MRCHMKVKAIIFLIVLILLLLVGFIYLFFNGNPILRAESKEIVIEYLEKNYPEQTFTIDDISYYPGEGTYIVHFVSRDGIIQGNIDIREGKIIRDGFLNLEPENQ